MKKEQRLSNKAIVTVVVAIIGAVATILAAVVTGLFTLRDGANDQADTPTINNNIYNNIYIDPNNFMLSDRQELHPESPNVNYERGKVEKEHARYAQAAEFYELAAEEYGELQGPNSVDRARALNAAGDMYKELGEYENALDCYFGEQAIYQQNWSSVLELSLVYLDIASVYQEQEKYDDALNLSLKAYRIVLNRFGEDDPNTMIRELILSAFYMYPEREQDFDDWLAENLPN